MATIRMADGREFDPVTKKFVDEKPEDDDLSLEDGSSSLPIVVQSQLRLEDLPAKAQQMNVIGAIIAYELMGMPLNEMCVALGCSLDQLETIQQSSAYEKTRDLMLSNVTKSLENDARNLLASTAPQAARMLVNILKAKKTTTAHKMKAAETILDRSGINTQDHHGSASNTLRIRIVRDEEIDITVGMNG